MEYLFLYFNYFFDYFHQSLLDFLTYLKHILLDFYLSISFWGELTTFKKSTHLCVWLHWLLVVACGVFPPCCGLRGLPSLLWCVGSSLLAVACGVSLLAAACRVFTCSTWPLRCQAWGRAPWPRMEPRQPAFGAWSLGHWAIRKVPLIDVVYLLSLVSFSLAIIT